MEKSTFSLINTILDTAWYEHMRDAYHLENSGQKDLARKYRIAASNIKAARDVFQAECDPKEPD